MITSSLLDPLTSNIDVFLIAWQVIIVVFQHKFPITNCNAWGNHNSFAHIVSWCPVRESNFFHNIR